ncbi:MAG: corrinoid protein [Chloroflexota bacterium]|nr:corrinoid protein [Chloroflexota bacterium]
MDELREIAENLIQGEASNVKELTRAALDKGIAVDKVLNDGLLAGMAVVGERFRKEEMFLPEVLFSTRAMKAGMDIVEPLLLDSGVKPIGKIVIGTVKSDAHDIGKNLVSVMLKGAGFEVIDLGTDVAPDKFVDAIKEQEPSLVGMSAMLGTSIPYMKTTIDAIEAAGLRWQAKVLIGGAIVTQSYADSIGADGYAPDAGSAVGKAKELLDIN